MRVEDQPAGEKWIRMTREEMCQWKGKGLIKGGGGFNKNDGGASNCQGIAATAVRHQFMHKTLSHVHSYPGSLSRRPVYVNRNRRF